MHKNIAIVFDFDDTLAHDSTSGLLKSMGVDLKTFWQKENKKFLDNCWDPVPAYMYQMIKWSQEQPEENRITLKRIENYASNIQFFDGVYRLFKHLSDFTAKNDSSFNIEYYIISSGLGDLISKTKIAKFMKDIFASDFSYTEKGEIDFPKKIVSFTDKTRYIFQISKGLIGQDYKNKPFEVNRKIEPNELRIPLANIIFIGDGFTDVPCFSLLNKSGGTAFAVYDKNNTDNKYKAWGFIEDGRVKNLHSTNYKKGSDLVNSIEMSIRSIIHKTKNVYQG